MPSVRELIGHVAAQNAVRVDEDDPIFAVSTINRLMLEEAVKEIISGVRATMQEFAKSAQAVDQRAGKLLADEVRRTATAWRDQINDDIKAAGAQSEKLRLAAARIYTWTQMIIWAIAGLASGAILFGFGVVLGRNWR